MQSPWGEIEIQEAHVNLFSRSFFAALAHQKDEAVGETVAALCWDARRRTTRTWRPSGWAS